MTNDSKMYEELMAALWKIEEDEMMEYGVDSYRTGEAAYAMESLISQLAALQAENAEKNREIERLKLHKKCASCGHDLSGDFAICRPCANKLDDDMKTVLSRVEAERDAAISDVPHDCEHCKHATGDGACKLLPDGDQFSPDYTDGFDRDGNCDHWEWRGA